MYIVMLLLLSMGVALTLAGCRAFRTEKQENLPEDPPICGDRTHRIDEAAPTTIVSKEITAFSASFYYTDQYEDGIFREGKYSFVIEESENREWILTMSGPFQASTVVEKEVLADVQEILDKYQLAESNGLYSVTAGLPPEFTPCALSVEYASGEQLAFTMDGDPGVLWYTAFLDYFLQVFIDAGHTEYLPPAEVSTITNCLIDFSKEETRYSYGILVEEDGRECFLRSEYDMMRNEILKEETIPLEPSLLEGLQEVIEDCGLEGLRGMPGFDSYFSMEQHATEGFLDLAIDYESGRQLYLQAAGDDIPEEWYPMREQLKLYLDAAFAAK